MAAPLIGQLRNRLTFLKDVVTSDGSGGYTSVKEVDFELWGYITKVSDYDQTQAGQELAYNAVEIWVLYQVDKYPNKQHVIISGNYTYTCNGIREIDEARRWVVISAARNLTAASPTTTPSTFDSVITTFDNEVLTFDTI